MDGRDELSIAAHLKAEFRSGCGSLHWNLTHCDRKIKCKNLPPVATENN